MMLINGQKFIILTSLWPMKQNWDTKHILPEHKCKLNLFPNSDSRSVSERGKYIVYFSVWAIFTQFFAILWLMYCVLVVCTSINHTIL